METDRIEGVAGDGRLGFCASLPQTWTRDKVSDLAATVCAFISVRALRYRIIDFDLAAPFSF